MGFVAPIEVNKTDIDIYDSEIESYIIDFLDSKGIEDYGKITSMQWAAALMYTYDHTFKHDKAALMTDRQYNDGYNIFAVNALCDKYIYLCYSYGQRICIEHFSFLSGIARDTLYRWRDDNKRIYIYNCSGDSKEGISGIGGNRDRLTISRADIFKKLVENTMVSADDIMLSKSGVNSIAYRNAVQERYNSRRQDQRKTYDAGNIALQLGITDKLASLPDHDGK